MGLGRATLTPGRHQYFNGNAAPGTTVFPTSLSGAYGSLVTLSTAEFEIDYFFLMFTPYGNTQYRETLTINTSSTDEPLVSDVFFDATQASGNNFNVPMFFR